VVLQCPFALERFTTIVTLEGRCLARMHVVTMLPQHIAALVSLPTFITHKRPSLAVRNHLVLRQCPVQLERGSTQFTHVRPGVAVNGQRVHPARRLLTKAHRARVTFVWFFTSMYPHVQLEALGVVERGRTHVTDHTLLAVALHVPGHVAPSVRGVWTVWAHVAVDFIVSYLDVPPHIRAGLEAFGASRTRVWSLVRVHGHVSL
jgi:hypothetical protein